jgi:4-amino-4-deoxy-L-arabinose transferase-like glycosyltransferase
VTRRIDIVLLLVLAAAFALRLQLAATERFIHDEENTSIPLSKTITLAPGNLHLPLRGENHGALPAYFVKASSILFGTTAPGYRAMHMLVSLCTIALIYLLTRQWYGPPAARWAAALLAFNEYYLGVSARATAHVPHLFFVALALFAFSRFLRTPRPASLYAAGAAVGLAFYCKEHSALLLPVFFVILLHSSYRQWLRGPHAYAAAALFVLVISPDLVWNMRTGSDGARVAYSDQPVEHATYWSHLARIGGIGFSPYPAMFYGRSAVEPLHRMLRGTELPDETPEYQPMNAALGVLLVGAVLVTTLRAGERDHLRLFLLLLFWGVFGFFTLIEKGSAQGRLDPVSWIWVEVTILPAVILAGARLAGAAGKTRIVLWACAGAALLYAGTWPAVGIAQQGLRGGQEAVSQISHIIQTLAAATVVAVRLHPLRAIGIALTVGAVAGSLVGFGIARFRFRRWLRGAGRTTR